jgi:uncharacterized SAM-binding protein YcdF (DUF218 family)
MLAGDMNVLAAMLLYEHGAADTFVFSTGNSEKTKAGYGPGIPTEAKVYSEDFLARIQNSARPKPTVILEEQSVNTYTNLAECLKVIQKHAWQKSAILSARYHTARIRALWDMLINGRTIADVDFPASEDIITTFMPGVYDDMVEVAYASPKGQKRLASEAQGLQDMRTGKYVVTEFQLAEQN